MKKFSAKAKQILASMLCLCMAVAMIPVTTAEAASFGEGDTREYQFYKNAAYNEFNSTDYSGDVDLTTKATAYNEAAGRYWKFMQKSGSGQVLPNSNAAMILKTYGDQVYQYSALAIQVPTEGKYTATLEIEQNSNGAIMDVYLIPYTTDNLALVTAGKWTTDLAAYKIYSDINTNSLDTAAKNYASTTALAGDGDVVAYSVPATSDVKNTTAWECEEGGEYILGFKKNVNSYNTTVSTENGGGTIVRANMYVKSFSLTLDEEPVAEGTGEEEESYVYDWRLAKDNNGAYTEFTSEIILSGTNSNIESYPAAKEYNASVGRNWAWAGTYGTGTNKQVIYGAANGVGFNTLGGNITYPDTKTTGNAWQYSAMKINVPTAGTYDMTLEAINNASGAIMDVYLLPCDAESMAVIGTAGLSYTNLDNYLIWSDINLNTKDTGTAVNSIETKTKTWEFAVSGDYYLVFKKNANSGNTVTWTSETAYTTDIQRTCMYVQKFTLTRETAASFGNMAVYIEKNASGSYTANLISAIDKLEGYSQVGFAVSVGNAGSTVEKDGMTNVYESIIVTGSKNTTVTAKKLGLNGGYVFVEEVDLGTAAAGEVVVFTPYAVDAYGNTIWGETFEATVTKG